jgi:hypothetical protein
MIPLRKKNQVAKAARITAETVKGLQDLRTLRSHKNGKGRFMETQKQNDLIAIDPATHPVIINFLDDFCPDPAIRLEMEEFFEHAARVNPMISPDILAQLAVHSEMYRDPKYQHARKYISFVANQAALGILQAYHEIKGNCNGANSRYSSAAQRRGR